MGDIINEMIRGYAKGYLFGQMVVGCFFLLLFVVFIGALLVLQRAHFLGEAPLDDRGKLLTPPIDRAQDELRQPRVTWHFNLFTNQNIDTAPEDDLGFNLGSHQASDLFEQEAGCRRIAGPETIERPDRVLVTLAGARMILGEVDRRRSGLELARHILDIPRVERAW